METGVEEEEDEKKKKKKKDVQGRDSPIVKHYSSMGRAHTTGENGKWGETKQRSENQVAFNSVLGPS
jgi:hypothetical protein